ncbi:MAG: peptide chain release factor N(5)-glutamine methyltransferase [Nitrosomonas sp.]|nr:peptide chain release factor N(5)-glutamine methyltransferase [Nitrosomonas sp.]
MTQVVNSIAQVLQWASLKIDRTDARMLLQHILNVNHAFLLTHSNHVLNSTQEKYYSQLVARRVKGEPIAYLIGECDFYDITLKVTPDVLIPRPETELLVELALKRISSKSNCRILDLGTGCGAIAITIAKHCPQASVIAVDLSSAAVSIARKNADIVNVKNVCIAVGNWFSELSEEKFDLIVSNPPYVAENDPHLFRGDLRFEPKMALTTESDGLACIRDIVATACDYLKVDGWLMLEHGYDQAVVCRQLLKLAGFAKTFSCPDLAGIMRVSGGQYSLSSQ